MGAMIGFLGGCFIVFLGLAYFIANLDGDVWLAFGTGVLVGVVCGCLIGISAGKNKP